MHTLHHFKLCPFSRSIRMLLGEIRLDAALKEERPWEWREDFLALNPSGGLPVLEVEGGPVLCGAYAIAEYLAEDPERARSPIFPGGRSERAEVRRLVDWFHGKCHEEVTRHLLQEKVYERFSAGAGAGPDLEILKAVRGNLRYHLTYVEHLASERHWLAGDELSYADFAAAAQLSCADYLAELAWDGFESARTWYGRMKSRPAFRTLLGERVPGTPAPPSHYADPDF